MNSILLVEDETIEREALKKIINENFDEVDFIDEAFNSEMAIQKINNHNFDLIFMDIKIPGINGLELSKYVKENYENTSIVITTAHDEFDFAHTAIKINVDDFLLKPIRSEKIVDAVKKYCFKNKKNPISQKEHLLIGLSNSIIKNDYFNAIDLSNKLARNIFQSSSGNLHSMWEEFSKVIENIIITAEDLNLYELSDLEELSKKLLNNYKIYTDEYLLVQEFQYFINQIFKKLLNQKKEFEFDIKHVKSYIEINIKKNITLVEISNYFNISSYYMSKLFKQEVGINFVEYVSNRKIDLSKEMLTHTNMRILNIALELGFNEPNYFSKVFKKSVGLTPTDYRNKTTN